jgi:DNA processing protein
LSVDESRAAYLALALTPGIGAVRLATLLRVFHSPNGALAAPFAFLCSLPGISRAAATAVHAASTVDGVRVLEKLEAQGGRCLLPTDEDFPRSLRMIPDPPTLLFVYGDTSLLARPAVAVVGSRDHSAYGAEVAIMVASEAAKAGVVVVSGMARGLDAVAHTAALDSAGGTIGVLGNGLGVIYPAANRQLYERVGRKGLLVTEFPPGERPRVGSFPRRNRLISGLARVTVVIEAAAGSGTMITVDAALEQGREVMAVPGGITSATSIGTNRLIRDGASPFLEPDDLLRFFPDAQASAAPGDALQQVLAIDEPLPTTLSDLERTMAGLVAGDPRHLDSIASDAGRPMGDVLAALSGLELAGVVEQLPGWWFRRVPSGPQTT